MARQELATPLRAVRYRGSGTPDVDHDVGVPTK
jgi:hypothetical protein